MLTVGSIIGGAFRLIKERPGAVAVWGLVYVAAGVATTFAMQPILEMQAASLGGGDPTAAMSEFWSTMRWFFLVQLLLFLLVIVVYTAALRAVLRPQEGGLAYIRFGMDELRMIGLSIIFVILFYAGMLVAMLILGLLLGAVFMGGGAAGGGILLMFIVPLLILGVAIWFYVRLSLAYPLTLLRRKLVIGESWRLTRGRSLTLFGAYLVIFLIVIAISIAISTVTAAPYLSELMRSGGNPDDMIVAAQNQLRQVSEINAMTILGWVLNGIVGGVTIALLAGAAATATRELTGDELLAREFA